MRDDEKMHAIFCGCGVNPYVFRPHTSHHVAAFRDVLKSTCLDQDRLVVREQETGCRREDKVWCNEKAFQRHENATARRGLTGRCM